MGDLYSSGRSFGDTLKSMVLPAAHVAQALYNPEAAAQSVAGPIIGNPGITAGHDFLSGLFGLSRPSVTVALPPATSAAVARVPAAKAAAATAAPKGKAAAAAIDPSAALGKLSFRQLLSLSQASENLQPKGTTKTPSAGDQAGQLLMQMTLPAFQSTLAKAKTDEDKQTIIDNYRDKVLLPIMSRGNPMAGMFDPGGQ